MMQAQADKLKAQTDIAVVQQGQQTAVEVEPAVPHIEAQSAAGHTVVAARMIEVDHIAEVAGHIVAAAHIAVLVVRTSSDISKQHAPPALSTADRIASPLETVYRASRTACL
jgi:hypothetical protein